MWVPVGLPTLSPLRTEVYVLLQFHRKLLATTNKGAVSTLAHNKDAMTSCPLSIFSNFTGIMLLVLIKYISFLASTTDKWVFLTLKIMNRPFLKAICLIHHNRAGTKTSRFHKNLQNVHI